MSRRFSEQYSEQAFAAVLAELNGERAAALGRVGRQLEAEFERCRALILELDTPAGDGAAEPVDAEDALARYRAARQELARLRWKYQVQREALNLIDQRWMAAFPMPPRR